MKEELLLSLIALLTCFGVALLLFKVIFDFTPEKIKGIKYLKPVFSFVYWFLFVLAINIPFNTYEVYELIPFEDGKYYSLDEYEDFGAIELKYKENGTTTRAYIGLYPYSEVIFEGDQILIKQNKEEEIWITSAELEEDTDSRYIVISETSSLVRSLIYYPYKTLLSTYVTTEEAEIITAFIEKNMEK